MPQKVAIYIRVSTQEQAQEGYSIDAQTDRLTAYCKAKCWPVAKIYTDPGFSGSNIQRPALQLLFEDIEAGRIDCVLVYKLDRLSRSQKDTLFMIEDIFLAHSVAFVSMQENFDTSTPFGRAMIGILSVPEARSMLDKFRFVVNSDDMDAKRHILHMLIQKIVVSPNVGEIEIRWNF